MAESCYEYDTYGNITTTEISGCTLLCQYYTELEGFDYKVTASTEDQTSIIEIRQYDSGKYEVYAVRTDLFGSDFTKSNTSITNISNVYFSGDSSLASCPVGAYHDTLVNHEVCFGSESDCLSSTTESPNYDSFTYFGVSGYATSTKTYDYTDEENYGGYSAFETVATCYYSDIEQYQNNTYNGSGYYNINIIDGVYYYVFDTVYELAADSDNPTCKNDYEFLFCPAYYAGTNNDVNMGTGTYYPSAMIYSYQNCYEYYDIYTSTSAEEFLLCETDSLIVFQLIGYCILAIKIFVPLIIIIMACIDIFKVIVSGEEKDMKTFGTLTLKRIVAGIIVFLLPTIVYAALNFVESASDTTSKFSTCNECLFNPLGDECSTITDALKND